MFELKKYDAAKKCEKCGSNDHNVTHSEGYTFFGHDIPEHLRVKCGMCSFEWFCVPLAGSTR